MSDIKRVSASDIITYIGVPLAVFGILPILWTSLKTLFLSYRVRQRLSKNLDRYGLREYVSTNTDIVSGRVDVIFHICRARRPTESPTVQVVPNEKRLKMAGCSWSALNWNIDFSNAHSTTKYTLTSADRLSAVDYMAHPGMVVNHAELIRLLLDIGALPDSEAFLKLDPEQSGLCLMYSPSAARRKVRGAIHDLLFPKRREILQAAMQSVKQVKSPGSTTVIPPGAPPTSARAVPVGVNAATSSTDPNVSPTPTLVSTPGIVSSNTSSSTATPTVTATTGVISTASTSTTTTGNASNVLAPPSIPIPSTNTSSLTRSRQNMDLELYDFSTRNQTHVHSQPIFRSRVLEVASDKNDQDGARLILRINWEGLDVLAQGLSSLGQIYIEPRISITRKRLAMDGEVFNDLDDPNWVLKCVTDVKHLQTATMIKQTIARPEKPIEIRAGLLTREVATKLVCTSLKAMAVEDGLYCSFVANHRFLNTIEMLYSAETLHLSAASLWHLGFLDVEVCMAAEKLSSSSRPHDLLPLIADLEKHKQTAVTRKRVIGVKRFAQGMKEPDTSLNVHDMAILLLHWFIAEFKLDASMTLTKRDVVEWTTSRMIQNPPEAQAIETLWMAVLTHAELPLAVARERMTVVLEPYNGLQEPNGDLFGMIQNNKVAFALVVMYIAYLSEYAEGAKVLTARMQAAVEQWKDVILY